MTVGELLAYLSGGGLALVFGVIKIYDLIKKQGAKEATKENVDTAQSEQIEQLIIDYNQLKVDIEKLYRDKAEKKDLEKLLDRMDRLIALIIQNNNG